METSIIPVDNLIILQEMGIWIDIISDNVMYIEWEFIEELN